MLSDSGTSTATGDPGARAEVTARDQATRVLWHRTLPKTLERVACLEETAGALLERRLDEDLRRRAVRAAHQLAGSVGSFGFADASALARAVHDRLVSPAPPDEAAVLALCQDVEAMRRELDPDERDVRPAGIDAPDAGLLVVVTPDDGWDEQVRLEAGARGMRHWRATDPAALADLGGRVPDALLLDLTGSTDIGAALDAVGRTCPSAATVVVTSSERLGDRAAMVRAGVGRVLPAESSARDAVDAVIDVVASRQLDGVTAVLWIPDQVEADAMALGLRALGLEVVTVTGAAEAWAAVGEHRPGLLVAGGDAGEVEQLCRVVRADARWTRLPLLAVLPRGSAAAALHEAGADDVVVGPPDVAAVVARIRVGLARARLAERDAMVDPLTGLPNDTGARRYLDRLLAMAQRHGRSLAVAALHVDGFARLNDLHGRATGDEVLQVVGTLLRESFRGADVAARLGGGEFLVALYDCDRHEAAERLRGVVAAALQRRVAGAHGPSVRVSVSAGVAESPADGRSVAAVRRAASAALRHARALGGGTVATAGTGQEHSGDTPAATVDVVIVEDDMVLASLLEDALATRGWSVARLSDGRDALRALAGADPRLRARVVLLDIDLPGLDGLSVLRRLADAGTLERTRVIVLTVRSTEAETVVALSSGAIDHVSKPFSLPVLLERVHRAMEDRAP